MKTRTTTAIRTVTDPGTECRFILPEIRSGVSRVSGEGAESPLTRLP